MSISVRATALEFDRAAMRVALDDGRALSVPLAWFPRLARATPEQRANWRIGYSGNGLHWDELDEDISVEGLLAGRGDATIPSVRILANAVLAPVGAAAGKLPDRALTACLAIRGPFYGPGGTMAVGRAANVWTDAEIRPRDLADDETRRRYAQRIYAMSGGEGREGLERRARRRRRLSRPRCFPRCPAPRRHARQSILYGLRSTRRRPRMAATRTPRCAKRSSTVASRCCATNSTVFGRRGWFWRRDTIGRNRFSTHSAPPTTTQASATTAISSAPAGCAVRQAGRALSSRNRQGRA